MNNFERTVEYAAWFVVITLLGWTVYTTDQNNILLQKDRELFNRLDLSDGLQRQRLDKLQQIIDDHEKRIRDLEYKTNGR